MSIICKRCGRTMDHGVTVIHLTENFVMMCDECYMDAEEYMEEMRGCGCSAA